MNDRTVLIDTYAIFMHVHTFLQLYLLSFSPSIALYNLLFPFHKINRRFWVAGILHIYVIISLHCCPTAMVIYMELLIYGSGRRSFSLLTVLEGECSFKWTGDKT